MLKPYFKSTDKKFCLLKGNSMELLPKINHKFDMVFADPPYFLSNNGLSIQSGKIVSVNKGKWDKSLGIEHINKFNRQWLSLVRDNMKEDATIWSMDEVEFYGEEIHRIGFGEAVGLDLLTDYKVLRIWGYPPSNHPIRRDKENCHLVSVTISSTSA